ncbi:MAG: zinc ribbon domain-containing protein [Oscillospiraceae bacterium]|nr:zinc ribbon domain-containing protein [Oscillospiraceae bacterium]
MNGNGESGRTAKKLAPIGAALIVIVGLILFITILVTGVMRGLAILLGLIYFGLFLFLAYWCYTVMTAIGDAAEHSENNNLILREIKGRLDEMERHFRELPAPVAYTAGDADANAPGSGAKFRRVCAKCGAEPDADAAFCGVCGAELVDYGKVYEVEVADAVITCPVCGRKQQPNRKKCLRCGAMFAVVV